MEDFLYLCKESAAARVRTGRFIFPFFLNKIETVVRF